MSWPAAAARRGGAAWRGAATWCAAGGAGVWARGGLGGLRGLALSGASGKNDRVGDSVRPGLDKTPIVDKLWVLREAIKRTNKAALDLKAGVPGAAASGGAVETRVLAPERQQVTYAFSSDAELVQRYLNFYGTIRVGRVRGVVIARFCGNLADPLRLVRTVTNRVVVFCFGSDYPPARTWRHVRQKVLEDPDALAGNIAWAHCMPGRSEPLNLVTASIDRIVLHHRPNLKDDIRLGGQVSWVGSSSLEISMEACSSWTTEPWLRAVFTFVARDPRTGGAVKVNQLAPRTDEERRQFALGEARAAERKRVRKAQGSATLARKHVERLAMLSPNSKETVTIEEAATALYAEAKPRLLMPSVAYAGSVKMSDTALSNTLIMQPQQMNMARRIFGGFLVRKAFELAFTTAYLFAKTVPRFIEIDSVEFRQPVDVGDLVHFTSKVLFCSEELHDQPSVHVEVIAYVVTPDTKKTAASMVCEVSNTFNFSYLVPKGTLLPTVYPASKEEALTIVSRYAADVAQKQEDLDNTAAPA